jgi:hypothetical protein
VQNNEISATPPLIFSTSPLVFSEAMTIIDWTGLLICY